MADFEYLFNFDGTFKKRKAEENFSRREYSKHAFRIRIVAALTGLAYLTGLISDLHFPGYGTEAFSYLLTARIVVFIIAAFVALSTIRVIRSVTLERLVFIYYLAITSSECFELALKPELSGQQLPFITLIMLTYSFFYSALPLYVLVGGICSTTAYTSVLLFVSGKSLSDISAPLIAFLLVNGVGFYFSRNIHKARRTEAHIRDELMSVNEELQQEIAERKKAQQQLLELATTDELTKVFNRRYFLEIAERELKRAARVERSLSLLFLDIDHFKKINDTYGHDVGDKVLIEFARLCSESIRGLDIFARYGGEEFAILLPEVDLLQAKQAATRLAKLIESTVIRLDDTKLQFTVSIGVSTFEGKSENTIEHMVKQADQALYCAKEHGRNQVVVWEASLAQAEPLIDQLKLNYMRP